MSISLNIRNFLLRNHSTSLAWLISIKTHSYYVSIQISNLAENSHYCSQVAVMSLSTLQISMCH